MACFTKVEVNLDNNEVNRQARKKLGLKEEGPLTELEAGKVRVEAGVIRTLAVMQRLAPTAVVRRDGDELTVTVNI